jgi:hypothetical protein
MERGRNYCVKCQGPAANARSALRAWKSRNQDKPNFEKNYLKKKKECDDIWGVMQPPEVKEHQPTRRKTRSSVPNPLPKPLFQIPLALLKGMDTKLVTMKVQPLNGE